MAFILKNYLKLSIGKQILNVCLQKGIGQKGLKTSSFLTSQHKIQKENTTQFNETTNIPNKSKDSPKITLIQNQNVTVTALEEAKHLAKRRSMHLVQVQETDAKAHRPVYKLVTSAEMLQNELYESKTPNESIDNSTTDVMDKAVSNKKSEKTLNIGSRITDHDLSSRLKNILKWLTKRNDVRIMIQGSSDRDMVNGEKIFKTIEEAIKTPEVVGKIVQKRIKGSIIKFNIVPVSPGTNKPASNTQ